MALSDIAKRFGKLTADNSPAILTAIGVTGCITTAVLTGKASAQAALILRDEENTRQYIDSELGNTVDLEQREELDMRQKIELTWRLYLPAVAMGGLTIAAIIMANRIGTRRAAALAAAYTMSKDAFEEYKEKIVEKLGPRKEQAARDELAQERINKNPPGENIFNAGGDQLCFEEFTGRYFYSTIQKLESAVNEVNKKVVNNYYASLGDFYDAIGLPTTPVSEEFGWNSDELMEVTYSAALIDERPVISVGYPVTPIRNYYRVC